MKGALRSALLQNWLSGGSTESDKALSDFLQALSLFSKRSDLKKHQQAAEIEKVFREKMEEKLFGNLKQDNRLAASCLRVQDTNAAAFNALAVYQLDRFNLLTGEQNIPVLKECIAKGTLLNTMVSIDYYSYMQKTYHELFRDIMSKMELFALLNNCSLELLAYEYAVMQHNDVIGVKLRAYEQLIAFIKEKIEVGKDNKAIIRLGFGKMQFYQTIALAIYKKLGSDENNRDWIQYLCYCNKMSDDLAEVYPSTRILTSSGQEACGWVQLS